MVSSDNGTDSYTFTYNARGITDQREGAPVGQLQQTVNSVPTSYTLDLAAPLTQVLQDCSNTYLYGLARLAQQDVSQTLYFLSDALDSVRQLADINGDLFFSSQGRH